jgi:hypothetical protein
MPKDPNWQVFTNDENRAAMIDGLREISIIGLSEILRSIVKYKIQRKIAQAKNMARVATTKAQNFYKQVEAMRHNMFDPVLDWDEAEGEGEDKDLNEPPPLFAPQS